MKAVPRFVISDVVSTYSLQVFSQLTLSVHWQVNVQYISIRAKNFLQVFFIDILRELLDNDLRALCGRAATPGTSTD